MARLPDDEIQRRLDDALARCRMSAEEALEKWPEDTPEVRDGKRKRSEIARAKHMVIVDDDSGQRMLGGPQPRSGPKSKKDIAEAISELADGERQREIIDALFSGLSTEQSPAVRGKAAERIVNIANEQREIERRDRDELRKLGAEDLIERIVAGIKAHGLDIDLLKRLEPAKPFDADATAVEL